MALIAVYDAQRADLLIFAAFCVAWVLACVLVAGLVRVVVGRRGFRCTRCLRPWNGAQERGWGDLEAAARRERRGQDHP